MSKKAPSFLGRKFFQTDVLSCARALVGCELVWGPCAGVIVETEAYAVLNDEACHTFSRPSTREFVVRNQAGTAYVYLNYGVHWLLNVLVKGGAEDGIVLIRALEPTRGLPDMQQRRKTDKLKALCSGPGKLCQALGVTRADHERDLCADATVGFRPRTREVTVAVDKRIGITKAADLPWRFLEHESLYVSALSSVKYEG